MALPWCHYFLISPSEAIARVLSRTNGIAVFVFTSGSHVSFFVVAVAVVWAPRTVEPFLFLWYQGPQNDETL
jgi:hypothetical protein